MKIAIHDRHSSFSERWIAYCKKHNIEYKIVNAYASNIIEQVQEYDAFIWHHQQSILTDTLIAKQILMALEHAGIKVFPNFYTGWHFDDKIAQKYLLEAIDAPLVTSYVFFDKDKAMDWVGKIDFPIVFKLRGGAGSANVKLVKTKKEAKKLVKKAFGRGFEQFDRWGYMQERINRFRAGRENLTGILKGIGRLLISTKYSREQHREKGYIYFQDFIPGNDSDIRVIVIGNRAFAVKRLIRNNDFRASGSGLVVYDREEIDQSCIQLAFDLNISLKAQSIAYDFVFDNKNNPLLLEISYGFSVEPYDYCPGFWDSDLNWHEGSFNPQAWIIEDLINRIES